MANAKDTCFQDLQQRILTMTLAPGDDLDEVSLSAHYGMSRTPLREVLRRLAGEGYVQITANRGAKVAALDITTLRTFFQTAPMIYATIARIAAETHRALERAHLEATQKQFRAAIEDRDAASAALYNHRFHAQIGDMAQNQYLMASLDRLLIDHTRLSQTFYRPKAPADQSRITTAADQHDAMIEAFAAHDADAAVQLALDHWDLSKDQMERFVHPDPLPPLPSEKDVAHAL